jgi:hypothetical protein
MYEFIIPALNEIETLTQQKDEQYTVQNVTDESQVDEQTITGMKIHNYKIEIQISIV